MSGRIGVLISGRGSHLRNLIACSQRGELDAQVVTVISNKPDAPGLQYAKEAGIESVVLPHRNYADREQYDEQLAQNLEQDRVDLVCLAGFLRLLSVPFVRRFPLRIMNVHPSLLPAFPGLHAQEQAMEYGVKVTGCTVHFIDDGLDSGPIILQKTLEVLSEDTPDTLADRLLPLEHKAYAEAVKLFFENRLRVEGRKVLIV
ncbi:phosphoribosylglycinamide formyltransferase [bacterium]|nr:phosphoribosylglycinamide formyltransferase [bacterium]MCI0605294.1 phosphoribosylglycinamide formyltransferase [bacterium]